jgi:hypothetical protein
MLDNAAVYQYISGTNSGCRKGDELPFNINYVEILLIMSIVGYAQSPKKPWIRHVNGACAIK